MEIDANTLLSSPKLFPLRFDWEREGIRFVEMSEDSYRQSSFLDDRLRTSSPDTYIASTRDLLSAVGASDCNREVHYILHSAFCCSTLLARHLDSLSDFFVLREPAVLDQLAEIKFRPQDHSACKFPFDFKDMFKITISLLARTYSSRQVAVVKTSDFCLGIGDHLAHHDSRTRIICISSGLHSFLLSVLKCPKRREWVRFRINQYANSSVAHPLKSVMRTETLSDAEAAASLWALYRTILEGLHQNVAATRLLTIDGDSVAQQPVNTIRKVARFLGRRISPTSFANALSTKVCNFHSKDLTLPYDNATRKAEFYRAARLYGAEAETGVRWVQFHYPLLLASP